MIFEWKRPRIDLKQQSYGQYLVEHPEIIPSNDKDLNTPGYVVISTDYGAAEDTRLPFITGDWLEATYVKENFIEL